MASWSQRIDKAVEYLRRGDLPGLIAEVRRFWTWKRTRGQGAAYPPTEFLLPQIRKHIVVEEFPFITANLENPDWSEDELKARIQELGSWEYYFAFAHGLTTEICGTFNEPSVEHHRFRSKLISETIVELLGDEIGQTTILDLACHCGILSLDMAFRGAKSVHGVEIREKNLKQARFLQDYYKIHNVTFEQGDVYELRGIEADVVMCPGLLYHVVRPIDLIEFCYRNCRKFAVIDTNCRKDPISAYYVVRDKNPESAIEGTRSIELLPTYRAVIDTMQEAGFKEIVEVVGTCDTPIFVYSGYTRRCFIGFKEEGCLKNVLKDDRPDHLSKNIYHLDPASANGQ
jgi:predicted RNA methylase